MSARSFFTLTLVAAGVLAPAAIADAAKTSAYPTISKIEPMKVSIGETMTITGNGFLKGKAKNTVVFRRSGKPNVFVKADGLSSTRLSLKLPEKLATSLGQKSGKAAATKFQIRVLAKRLGKTYTPMAKSPTIVPKSAGLVTPLTKATETTVAAPPAPAPAAPAFVAPADCDGDGTPDDADADDDNDLLIDTTEVKIGTNRCVADTDGDGNGDGWEYQAAVDKNQRSCPKAPAGPASHDYPKPCQAAMPYPGRRTYPNPLSADADVDFDGDWIPSGLEHKAFVLKGKKDAAYRELTGDKGMWYSDGKQASVDTAPDTPVDNDCVGMEIEVDLPFGGDYERPEFELGENTGDYPDIESSPGVVKPEYAVYLPSRGDGNACLNDAERDEDGDFLANSEELSGPMSGSQWWAGRYKEPRFDMNYWRRDAFTGTDWLDADTDGDGTIDSLDDDDGDDFLNIEELVRGNESMIKGTYGAVPTGDLDGLWVDPFNPCLPAVFSRSCPIGIPLSGTTWRPWRDEPDGEAPVPRWPTYGTAVYDKEPYPDPTWSDDSDPLTPPQTRPNLLGPTEKWTTVPPVAQTYPPQHPLPRP